MKLSLIAVLSLAVLAGCQNQNKSTEGPPLAGNTVAEVTPTPAPSPAPTTLTPPAEPVVTEAPATTAPPSGNKSYVVKRGDTLWSIAKSSYGDGKQYKRIMAANPGVSPNALRVGQTLMIP